ncbi:3889_t:CDS:1, partial [Dentiscutata heterogama]
MSLKFYIIFVSVLLMAFSAWTAPVANDSGLIDVKSLKKNATRRDTYPNQESSSGFYKMADLKNKRGESSENEINELSKCDDADEHKLSKRAL